MRTIGNRWALGFVGLGVCALIGHIALAAGFAVSGERVTRTLRSMAFKAMVSGGKGRRGNDRHPFNKNGGVCPLGMIDRTASTSNYYE